MQAANTNMINAASNNISSTPRRGMSAKLCERCKFAHGCALKPMWYGDIRHRHIVCVNKKGAHINKPDLFGYDEGSADPDTQWEDLSSLPSLFDPFVEDRNEKYGEERLSYPHTRLKQWMDDSESRYNQMLRRGRAMSKPHSDFERTCKNLATLKHRGVFNINDLSTRMDQADKRLREYELKRFGGKHVYSIPRLGAAAISDRLAQYKNFPSYV